MKKYILFIISIGVFTCCSDYLDVKPQSQIDKDILFETEEGFMEALNGIYSNCTSDALYGNELTFGFPDVLAQNYSVVDLNSFRYEQTMKFNHNDQDFMSRKNAVWEGLYRAIGNCNLLLDNIDSRKGIFTANQYPLIKGEAIALRGYIHLDVIRLFAPSYQTNPAALAIPYVTRYSNRVSPQLVVSEALDSVIADLTRAKQLLSTVDPILDPGYVVGYTTDGDDADELPDDDSTEEAGTLFNQNRRHRMNYYAVCGALARAHLCRGNSTEALANAVEVIESAKFPWVAKEDFSNVEVEEKDRILYPELIFAWSIATKADALRNRFESGQGTLHTRVDPGNAIYETATAGAEDLRYKNWFKQVNEGGGNRLVLQKYKREDTNIHPLVAPAIRLSEMYYIAAECIYNTDQTAAWEYFNTVRLNRGIAGAYEIWSGTKEELLNHLVTEARKEFFGEGQIFYMYKRLNKNIKALDGSVIMASNDVFVLPLPDDEIELGQRN